MWEVQASNIPISFSSRYPQRVRVLAICVEPQALRSFDLRQGLGERHQPPAEACALR